MITTSPWELETSHVYRFALRVLGVLKQVGNYTERDRTMIVYYAIATHYLHLFDTFPVLDLYEPQGRVKSSTVTVLAITCFTPVLVTGTRGLTEASLMAKMTEANGGTLIIKESDVLGKSVELTIARSGRQSGLHVMTTKATSHAVPHGLNSYGPTILHHRHAFPDVDMLRMTAAVRVCNGGELGCPSAQRFVPRLERLQKHLVPSERLPTIDLPNDMRASAVARYWPLLVVAGYLGDYRFIRSLVGETGLSSGFIRKGVPRGVIETMLDGELDTRVK